MPPASFENSRTGRADRGPLDSNDIYDNGPINGNTDAWDINFGFIVSDSFTFANDGNTITGMTFAMWLFPGDTLTSTELSITSGENGGTSYFDQTMTVTQGSCTGNQYGFNVCTETASFTGPTLNAGTYWVNLQNASVPSGDPVYWDENSGAGCTSTGCPSLASQSSIGSIPSESFTILGNGTSSCSFDSQHQLYELRDLGPLSGSNYPAGVAVDRAGNLYGTLSAAGSYAQGLIYSLALRADNWFFSSLYSFLGGSNGSSPDGVIVGPEGDLFGAASGGIQNCGRDGTSYCGLIYQTTPPAHTCANALCSWNETAIYQFTGNTDAWGGNITAFDSAGNMYGLSAPFLSASGAYGYGAIFELSPSQGTWTEKVLYNFTGGTDGAGPSSLLMGRDGNLYGTATGGGTYGAGVVFQLVPSAGGWTENVLYSFTGGVTDGGSPGGLIQDSHGNFYGFSECSTQSGGCPGTYAEVPAGGSPPPGSYASGVIFELSPPGGVTFLNVHSGDEEFCPTCGQWSWFFALTVDPAGNLYAAADGLGYYYPNYCYCGAVGKANDYRQMIWSYSGGFLGNLTSDAKGNLYGTVASCGPENHGMVWQYSP